MASPVHMLHNFSSENLFDTPNFDEGRDDSSADNDFSYFDSIGSGGDSYLLEGGDYSQWPVSSKGRAHGEPVVDPFLSGDSTFNSSGLDFGPGEAMFGVSELTPPPSAVDETHAKGWPGKLSKSKPGQKLPSIDTQNERATFEQNHGQITPPMSSKSPESDDIAEASSKRGRKPTAKAKKETASPAAKPAKPARKSRKTKPEGEEEEPQTEEAKAKRARFLERNRQAAYTCRQRKKQWARDLEDRHRDLERENQNLKMVLVSLKDEFHYLRQQAVSHTTCECTGAREYIQRSSRVLAGDSGSEAGSASSGSEHATAAAAASSTASTTAGLEQALRASLAQLQPDHLKLAGTGEGLDFVHEGPELDGMTL